MQPPRGCDALRARDRDEKMYRVTVILCVCVEFCALLGMSRNAIRGVTVHSRFSRPIPSPRKKKLCSIDCKTIPAPPAVFLPYSRLALCAWGDLGRRTGRRDARFLERNYPWRFELVHLMLKDLDRALQAPSEGFDRDISSPLNLTLAHHC